MKAKRHIIISTSKILFSTFNEISFFYDNRTSQGFKSFEEKVETTVSGIKVSVGRVDDKCCVIRERAGSKTRFFVSNEKSWS